jgi:tRNA-specific 2-thiouridylase
VPDGDYMKILRSRLASDSPALTRGPILTSDGTHIADHSGYAAYTIGQRKGLPGGFKAPMYVVGIVPEDRAVIIGPREELLGSGVIAREVNWLSEVPPIGSTVAVRIRHRAPLASGEVIRIDDDEIEIALGEPVSAITPGQSIVLYDGERVLGGGFIERASGASASLRNRSRQRLPILAA